MFRPSTQFSASFFFSHQHFWHVGKKKRLVFKKLLPVQYFQQFSRLRKLHRDIDEKYVTVQLIFYFEFLFLNLCW